MTFDYKHYHEPLAKHSAIWGDHYALTMSAALFENGEHNTPATFHAYIRKNPFDGGYLITAGQNIIKEWLDQYWAFDKCDIEYMHEQTVLDGNGSPARVFSDAFIDMCANAKLELTIDAMEEGEMAFPDEPIYRIHGPLWQCLMVESPILNVTNSQSLFATLASRLVKVSNGDPILEFGLRRAQSVGGLESSRASYIGGITATSNNEAGKYYAIPNKGTFAHAWVMVQEDELEAFVKYAKTMPHSGVFLVDTYNTIGGVLNAVNACRQTGIDLKGIRLDSGDLAYLSKQARTILNDSGFPNAKITASNDLDERTILSLKAQGAMIDIWGVGTNLVTSQPQPALGAVYKLGAIYKNGIARDVIKLSEDSSKVTIPGELDVLRYIKLDANQNPVRYDGDTIVSCSLENLVHEGQLTKDITSVRKGDDTFEKTYLKDTSVFKPLVRMFDGGKRVAPIETIHHARVRAGAALALLDETHKRLLNPHVYVVGLEKSLHEKRVCMIKDARAKSKTP